MKTPWDFVEKYYPDYYHSDEILRANDLQKIVDKEMDENSPAEDIFINECDENMTVAMEKYNEIHVLVYEKAIENYLKTGGE